AIRESRLAGVLANPGVIPTLGCLALGPAVVDARPLVPHLLWRAGRATVEEDPLGPGPGQVAGDRAPDAGGLVDRKGARELVAEDVDGRVARQGENAV